MSHPVGDIVTCFTTSPPEKQGLLSRQWMDGRRDRAILLFGIPVVI